MYLLLLQMKIDSVKFILLKPADDMLTNELDMKNVKCNNIYSAMLELKTDLRKIRDMIIT